ncbi:MAG: superoxide dismutase [Phycisphaeraceae bacterium]|nr:MAG: superoxide dismutase [Phycisphaeraceae bacterium]
MKTKEHESTDHSQSVSPEFTRRDALTALGAIGALAATPAALGARRGDEPRVRPPLTMEQLGWDQRERRYKLPDLPYAPDALEPHIDAETMRIHHGRHHQGYVNGLNRAMEELAKIRAGDGDAGLIKHWSRELAFHGAGHVNHALFWLTMAPSGRGGGGRPSGELAAQIDRDFGSFDGFATHFKAASNAVEASGWGWLVFEPTSRKLLVMQGEKQQDLTIWGVRPLMGVDVWEHAYYLKYQNRRGDYVDAFMNVINWPMVERLFAHARM